MKIALADEMRQIDKFATEKYGIPEIVLMENAGKATSDVVLSLLGEVTGKNVTVIVGSGNNGGDGFVAARHLSNQGAVVRVFLLGTVAHLKQSVALNRDICINMGIDVFLLENERDWDKLEIVLRFTDIIVDAYLGTGFVGELSEKAKKLITLINNREKTVVAIDIPSGVDSDTGAVRDMAIQATMTVTMGLPKMGHFFCPGTAYTGKLMVDGIGIPSALISDNDILQEYLDDEFAFNLLRTRPVDVHKGNCGRILVVAGSIGMTGAAVLASTAALRAGAGIVTLASAESLNEILEIKTTEVMTLPLPERSYGIISSEAIDVVLPIVDNYDVLLLGPGLGRHEDTLSFVRGICRVVKKRIILDADALYAYRSHTDEFKNFNSVPILTPHLGEMASLLGITVDELRTDILGYTRKAAAEWNVVIVLKSECTIIVSPHGMVWVTSKGNPAMATAGTGDVLSGVIAGLTMQTDEGAAPLLGVYLHGLAGDISAENLGDSLIAGDIVKNLAKARLKLANGTVNDI